MGYLRFSFLLFCLLPCLLLSACGTRQESSTQLLVHNAAGDLVFSAPLAAGQEFGVRFTHSVALSPVEEWFKEKDNKVALLRTVYADFGAGLPFEEQPGQRMVFRNGKVELSGFDLTLERLEVRVGRVAEHELLLPSVTEGAAVQVLPLKQWARPGEVLIFSCVTNLKHLTRPPCNSNAY